MNKLILKIKAFIYRNTGIYLAHREEANLIRSKAFWDHLEAWHKEEVFEDPKTALSPRNIYSILVSSWQMQHGFYKIVSASKFRVNSSGVKSGSA